MRASFVPRFVLETTAHGYGSPERQQVVRLAINIERCTRYRLLDADTGVASHRRHFHAPDRGILVNKPKFNRRRRRHRDASRLTRASVPTEQRVAA